MCARASVCMYACVCECLWVYVCVYALDSFRPGLGQVAVSSEPGDESSSSNAGG
jgi:hypothetical protein